jgi:ligand-binding sensor domain-containing protein
MGASLAGGFAGEHWNEDQGVPTPPVTAVLRTSDGFLWVGSRRGLSRFDGVRFVAVTADDGHTPAVLALLETQEGVLWVGESEGLSRLTGRTLQRTAGLHEPVLSLAQGRDGPVYVGLNSGAGVVRGDGVVRLEGCPSSVLSLAEDAKGVLWAGSLLGLCRRSGTRLDHLRAADGGSDEVVRTVAADPGGGPTSSPSVATRTAACGWEPSRASTGSARVPSPSSAARMA